MGNEWNFVLNIKEGMLPSSLSLSGIKSQIFSVVVYAFLYFTF